MKTSLIFAAALLTLLSFAKADAKPHTKDTAHARKHAARADQDVAAHPDTYDALIEEQARIHGVPVTLVHRVVMRESRYRPDAIHRIFFGLMQITYATARSMGYKGTPQGLLDAQTNLTYAVPYLANAYVVADNDEDRAVALYSSGYFFEAKRKHKLASLRTATSDPVVVAENAPVAPVPEPPANPVAQLFQALASPAPPPEPAPQQTADASAEMVQAEEMAPVPANVPLPPRRPNL
jgi:soluble lytic murein transglycosylase-like protein